MSESQQTVYSRSISKESTRSLSRERSIDGLLSKNNSVDEHDNPITALKETDIRRDSSSSNDSSGKKQASLNEIQDLYSALQDLVKTNVTATPVASRSQHFLTSSPDESKSSPRGSPRLEKLRKSEPATLRLNEPTTILIDSKERKISSKANKSASEVPENSKKEKNSKQHKRGASTGTLETMVQKMRKSPKSSRKLSHDTHSTSSDKENVQIKQARKSERSSSAVSDKIKKDTRIFRRGSNASDTKSKKHWKPKIFSRLRSKSSHGMLDDDEEEKCASEGDGGNTPPLTSFQRGRRSSEADANGVEIPNKSGKSSKKQLTCPPVRKQRNGDSVSSLCSANIKDINQLVAALHLEYAEEKPTPEENTRASPRTSYKSPESELSKLESWFEKAAAEAVLNQSKSNLDDDSCDSGHVKKFKPDNDNDSKKTGARRTAAVRRGHSQNHGREQKRYLRRSAPKNMNADCDRLRVYSLGQLHARSTPNLRDNDSSDLSDAENEKPLLKDRSPGELRRNISLDEPCRLPKTPLFYVPDQKQSSLNGLKIVKQSSLLESDVFYNGSNNSIGNSSTTKTELRRHEPDSVTQTKHTESEESPKSNTLFTANRYIELSVNAKKLKTDDNANFCEANITDEKSIWDRFCGDGEKKPTAIMT